MGWQTKQGSEKGENGCYRTLGGSQVPSTGPSQALPVGPPPAGRKEGSPEKYNNRPMTPKSLAF